MEEPEGEDKEEGRGGRGEGEGRREGDDRRLLVLSCVRPFVTPWTAARQAPPSIEFSRQKYWSG